MSGAFFILDAARTGDQDSSAFVLTLFERLGEELLVA
jgi:hypothetical protein